MTTLVARGMRECAYIVSDDHPGLGAERKSVLEDIAVWQRCQYHLDQNAMPISPPTSPFERPLGKEHAPVWNAGDGKAAVAELGHLVAAYRR